MRATFAERVRFLYHEQAAAQLRPQASASSHLWGTYNGKIVPTSVWLTGAIELWNQGFRGQGIKVAVIDSGVASHDDLNDNVIAHYDFVDVSGAAKTMLHDHGTHVAGTIAGNGRNGDGGILGVAPEAKIVDYRVLDKDGFGSYEAINSAIRHAADRCDIINLSLGGPFDDPDMHKAIQYAVREKNVLVVVASGNYDGASAPVSKKNAKVSYPAYYPEVVGVGAVDLKKTGKVDKAYFSFYNGELDLCADGVDLVSCGMNNDYTVMSGTSMASPVVAGFAALLLSKARESQTIEVSEPTLYAILKGTSIPLKTSSTSQVPPDWLYGRGLASIFPAVPIRDDGGWAIPYVQDGAPNFGN